MNARDRRDRVAEEAAEWVLRLQSEDMSRSERLQFVQWLRESPLHVGEMLRLSRVHAQLAEFPGWNSIPPADVRGFGESLVELEVHSARQSPARSLKQPQRRSWTLGAVVSALSTLVLTVMYFVYDRAQTIETGAAERREVGLPDGTLVRLNPQTTLRLRYTEHARGVLLARGDALFRVAKDPTKPFLVQTDHTRVRAVGTAFGVEHDGDSVIITVEEGRVAVMHAMAEATPTKPSTLVTEVSLGANQQIVVPRAGPIGRVHRVDSRRELAWADGRLVFDHDEMAEVVQRFNRFNRVQIQILDPKLSARRVSAVFNASDPEAFVLFLESEANVRVTRPSPNLIIIASEGPN